jgi:predicted nuclease of predicted toxin-antitoxin system
MCFDIDTNLSPKWVSALEQSGFEAKHWLTIGPAYAGDPEIMAYAKEHGFVVLTNDLDFGSILAATGGNAPSVVQLRTDDCRVRSIADLVMRSIKQAEDQLAKGALVTIETTKLRITSLPIGALL